MSNVSARYALNDDGSIPVVNRGCDEETGKWEETVQAFRDRAKEEGFDLSELILVEQNRNTGR